MIKPMRIMGLDYGSKTIGVAVSDPMGLTAQGIETITREEENKLRKSLRRIEELVEQYQVEEIVLGFPKNMNNTIGERAEKSLQLKETLERRLGLPVAPNHRTGSSSPERRRLRQRPHPDRTLAAHKLPAQRRLRRRCRTRCRLHWAEAPRTILQLRPPAYPKPTPVGASLLGPGHCAHR